MAVADASLRTVIDSMSFGLIEFNALRGSAALTPLIAAPATMFSFWSGTPSTTYRGLLLAEIEVPPRTVIWTPPPGSPLFDVTRTPATRPERSWLALAMTPTLAWSALTVETDPVIDSRR